MDKISQLFNAIATAFVGRNGHTVANDGSVKADLSVQRAMGDPGKPRTSTSEHLFAAAAWHAPAVHSTIWQPAQEKR
jgi:lipoyl-dependent peroxiredoxin